MWGVVELHGSGWMGGRTKKALFAQKAKLVKKGKFASKFTHFVDLASGWSGRRCVGEGLST